MGYEFDNGTQIIQYAADTKFYQNADLAIGCWVYFIAGVNTGFRFLLQADAFPIIQLSVLTTVSNGYGVEAVHIIGGGASHGVDCIPGQVSSQFKLNANTWLYFGFTRDSITRNYYSYFGTRAALIDGPVGSYLAGQDPLPITQPGQTLGNWDVGTQVDGMIIGPAHYWGRKLSKSEHLLMAQCTLPSNVNQLIWWVKMLQGAADSSPNNWTPTFLGTPLPPFVPDQGCASFAQGIDYRAYYDE